MPVSIFSVVDLPAPLGPMKATRSPRAMVKERSRTAGTCTVGAGRSLAPRRRHPVARADRTRKLLLNPSTVIAGMIDILLETKKAPSFPAGPSGHLASAVLNACDEPPA